jgi:hypothetical protein
VIATLRRILAAAMGRGPAARAPQAPRDHRDDAEGRLDAARRRLRASIASPED